MSTDRKRGENILCRNWSEYPSIRDVVLRLREIDSFCFGNLQLEDWGTVEGWSAIAAKNPHMNVCLEIDGRIMGSVHWLWLNRAARDRFLAGKLRDGLVLPEDTVATPPHHEPVYLYLLSMMVHPECQGRGYLRKLWNHAVTEHAEWRKKGMIFEEAYATAWSDVGLNILSSAGGEIIGADQYGHHMLRLPVPVRKLLVKADPKTGAGPARAGVGIHLSPESLFPQIPGFREVNLNEWLREHCTAHPSGAESYQREIERLNREMGTATYGGWMEYREWMWADSYMKATRKYTHLGIDVYLPSGTPVQLPFEVTVLDTFYDEDSEVGWGGRLAVQREPGRPVIVLGHLEAKLPPVGTVIPAGTPLGRLATWPENGNVFEHLHLQLIRPELLLTLNWETLDGYGFEEQARDFPHPFLTGV